MTWQSRGRNLYDQFYDNRSVLSVAQYFDISSRIFESWICPTTSAAHVFSWDGSVYRGQDLEGCDFHLFRQNEKPPGKLVHLTIANLEDRCICDQFLFTERQAEETATMMLMDDFPLTSLLLTLMNRPLMDWSASWVARPTAPLRFIWKRCFSR